MMRLSSICTICYYLLMTALLCALTTSSAAAANSLKWVRVYLPEFRRPGDHAQLECEYDLGNETLYAVKWYKDNEEFYRFVPKERPQTISHKVDGVRVDMSRSDSKRVVLQALSLRTSGLYRCEVSAEAPSFASAQNEGHLEVVSFAKENPIITAAERQYRVGDEINLNCTSGKSHPASILHWYINDKQVTSSEALKHYPVLQHRHGLVTTTLGLRFVLSARHFHEGTMRVKCTATVTPKQRPRERNPTEMHSLPLYDSREALLLMHNAAASDRLQNSVALLLLTSCIVVGCSLLRNDITDGLFRTI